MTKTTLSDLARNPSCMDDYDPNAMSVAQAKTFIAQFLSPVNQTEKLATRAALGRVLAADIVSPANVPAFANSAMDGYAFAHADLTVFKCQKLAGTAFAGKPFSRALQAGECIKIMTGAPIPAGADTVEMQERAQLDGENIYLNQNVKFAQHVRQAGEDLALGQTVLAAGRRLTPADLGLLASLGIANVSVFRSLKIAFFSTGDELISVGQALQDGQIYDSNRYTLFGMLSRLNVEINDLGNVPDNPDLLEKTLLEAAQNNDVVITSGGVSVGEADYMKALLAKHGQVLFWKINMKPGRPLAYGKIGQAHYFGLPGNPVSAMVTFYQFVQPALQTLAGAAAQPALLLLARCVTPIKKATGRTEFQRGILQQNNLGELNVTPLPNQGSGVLSSMSQANCFIVLDETVGNCEAGKMVSVEPFSSII